MALVGTEEHNGGVMVGYTVNRGKLDLRVAEMVIAFRSAIEKADIVQGWLALHPSDAPGGDVLTLPITPPPIEYDSDGNPIPPSEPFVPGEFGYTEDEAYLIRDVTQKLFNLNTNGVMTQAKGLTGLD